jgi:hypothetical protein
MTYLCLPLLAALCACGPEKAIEEKSHRLSPQAATTRVADYIRAQKPSVKLPEDFAVVDLTTDATWDRLRVQVVKVKDGPVEASETFVLRGEKVLRIGRGIGGDGVTSVVVADLAGDERSLLIYAFAWGSGLHRSQVGVLDLHGKEPRELLLAPANLSMDDFEVRAGKDGVVQVWVDRTMIGRITAVREKDVLRAKIDVSESLPEAVQRHLKY